MKKEITLLLTPSEWDEEGSRLPLLAAALGMQVQDIAGLRILRKSIDARGRHIKVNVTFEVFIGEEPASLLENEYHYDPVENRPEVVVVGAGPAGYFASLRLIELGFRPVLLERGKEVGERKRDIELLENDHLLNSDSNYCFGEGGAGTFSDGKLYTRSKKRGDSSRILEILYLHGAPENILYESHPHVGSDKLPEVVARLRKTILQAGGTVQFNSRVIDIGVADGQITHVLTSQQEKITGKAYILATGHSARDVYYLLQARGIALEAKPYAMGIRVEHPQELINHIQYHGDKSKYLPAASYNMVDQINNRGVYSFCMCPGGQIVPSATAASEIVVNGMSVSQRNSPFANSGIVVQILPTDYASYQNRRGLEGLCLQEQLEQKAYRCVQKGLSAPAQRLTDFVSRRSSQNLPVCSYQPGTVLSPLHEWLPPFICENLQLGFKSFNTRMKGYLSREAIIVGIESRTSSPVRIPRNPETGCHPMYTNLFTAGEGSGYSGGIVSSAVDGENMANFCARHISGN